MWFNELFGDTSEFALRLSLFEDPHTRMRENGTSAEALWGTFELWTSGKCLTRNRRDDGAIADGVTWYTLPLLHWFRDVAVQLVNEESFPGPVLNRNLGSATEWYLASEEPPFRLSLDAEDQWFNERSGWSSGHNLRRAFPGAAAPAVLLRRVANYIEVSWDNEIWPPTRPDIEFIEPQGVRLAPVDTVGTSIRRMLRTVASRVRETHGDLELPTPPDATRYDDWRWLLPATVSELISREDGLRSLKEHLTELAASSTWPVLDHNLETLLLRTHQPTGPDSLLQVLSLAALDARPGGASGVLESIRNPTPPSRREPWRQGYDEARRVREALNWNDDPAPPLGDWLRQIGCGVSEASVDELVDGATIVSRTGSVLVHANPAGHGTRRWSRQMIFGTGLGLALMDAAHGRDFAQIQGPWAYWPSAARARAFAAMLLMPDEAVKETVSGFEIVDEKAVTAVMNRFGTGLDATTWHLMNRGVITDEQRVEIKAQVIAMQS